MGIADLIILTINALQIAPGKENITDPPSPADDGLLTLVQGDGCNMVSGIAPAISQFPLISVYAAGSRAKNALIKLLHTSTKISYSIGGQGPERP